METENKPSLQAVADETKVVNIHSIGKNDIRLRNGQVFKFNLFPAHGHMDVVYTVEKDIAVPFTGEIRQMLEVMYQDCVQLKWWEKYLLRRTEEWKIKQIVAYYKNFVAEIEALEIKSEQMLERINR